MKCKAAVIHGVGEDWSVEEIEVDSPKTGEVLVKWTHAGLCHSDEHLLTGDFVPPAEALEAMGVTTIFPMIGGHEGSGVVAEVGPGVTSVAVGDHVSASFVPSCGVCRYCTTGRQNLCDRSGFGSLDPRFDIPDLLSMYCAGTLELDELVSTTYALEDINVGYRAMRDGENLRGVVEHAP